MRSKRIVYFAIVMFFVVLVCSGCLDKEIKWKQKTTKKLEKIMELKTGPEFREPGGNYGKMKRSLALFVADDHAKLAALFMTKRFDLMADEMGIGITLDGVEMNNLKDIEEYWEKHYDGKVALLKPEQRENLDSKYTIELQFWSEKIIIGQYQSVRNATGTFCGQQIQYRKDGESTEFFEFKVVLRKLNDKVIISNQSGNGEWPRGHSEECPWI